MSSLFIFYKKPNDSSIIPVVTLKIRYIFLTFFFLFNVMVMHFRMMEISTVCGLVKEQLFILALAYLFDLSLLLSPLSYRIPYCSSLKTRGGKAAIRPNPLELSFNFSDPTCSRPSVKISNIILEH